MSGKGLRIRRPAALVLGLLLGLFLAGTQAFGQEGARSAAGAPKPPSGRKAEIPLRISAAQMEADQEQRQIVFKGQVKAEYGEDTLYADQLLVIYKPKDKIRTPAAGKSAAGSPLGDLGGEEIDRIEARGNVRYVQGDRVATGEKAIYYRDQDEIVLLGNPQVWRGENHLKGSKITINLLTKKVAVESSPQQRVEAHLYQTTQGGKTPGDLLAPKGTPPATRPGRPR
ncbi:MAG: LptA/OstA family protein [Desulfobaccales bacterium]